MRAKTVLAALALAATATAAGAADLPAHTRLGTLFAEPVGGKVAEPRVKERPVPIVLWLGSPRVAGLYGRPDDFYYSNYYGTPWWQIFSRATYSCVFYGRC
jgi:hypothetical protein